MRAGAPLAALQLGSSARATTPSQQGVLSHLWFAKTQFDMELVPHLQAPAAVHSGIWSHRSAGTATPVDPIKKASAQTAARAAADKASAQAARAAQEQARAPTSKPEPDQTVAPAKRHVRPVPLRRPNLVVRVRPLAETLSLIHI